MIADIRERVEVSMVGSPLTIKRFCRRDRGTYGPVMKEGMEPFLSPKVFPIDGLFHCGDSCMPGIGVPSAAGRGITTANTIVPVWKQWNMLNDFDRLQREGRTPPYEEFQHSRGPQTKTDSERGDRFSTAEPSRSAG